MTLEHFVVRLLNELCHADSPQPKGRDLVLGTAESEHRKRLVILREDVRPMHVAVMGLSGVGKTYFLENLIRQDIQHGTGCVIFDVHGDLADNLLAFLAGHVGADPELRGRVVIVEPFDANYSIGFNPLERAPDTSPFLQAQELAHILHSRWETRSFGVRTEELLRNALYTLSAQDLTLVELPYLLANADFRHRLVRGLGEATIVDYWKDRYDRLSVPMRAAVCEPLLTRISAFLADPQIRESVGQRRSTFSFRDAIAQGRWVIINLSKGRLGENSAVLGSLFFTKLVLDVIAQSRLPQTKRRLFAVYADELQNLAGRNFATLIAEARKYRVSVTAGHQFWYQLSPELRAAMLGVGSRVLFRLHYHDAQELAGELEPTERQWYTELLTRLPRGQAVYRTGADSPLTFQVLAHRCPKVSTDDVERLRSHSRSLYATLRMAVRDDIARRYHYQVCASIAELLHRSPPANPTAS